MTVINLGNLKFTWKGEWAQSTAYNKDDIVKYGPSVYVCVDAHTSASAFVNNASKFEVMAEGLENKGAWSSATLYQKGQTVTYGGAVYIALQESTNQNPYDTVGYWQKFVDGQQYEGDFDPSVNYQKGDIIYYGGYSYVAKQNTIANNPTNATYWDIYIKGFEVVGNYNNATQYKPGDVVTLGGNRYVVKEGQRPLNILPTNTTYYDKILDGFSYKGDWNSATEYYPGDTVKYGGKTFVSQGTIQGNRPDQDLTWTVLSDGQRWRGTYSNSNNYFAGDLVKHGGRIYICIESYENDGSTTPEPANSDFWNVFSDGIAWQGSWSGATTYKINDVVEYAQSSYISLIDDNLNVIPGTDAAKWSLVAQGDSNAVITTRGDILTRDATQAVRLPIGPSGSFLTSDGTDLKWGHLTPQNDYYVSPQGNDTNDGRTPTTSWKTIRHACDQTFNLGQCRINVQSGTYAEQCPIRVGKSVVLEGNGLGAVTIGPNTTRDEGFGVGISDDGSTPNANSYVFHMNNGCRMRNFVFRNFSTGSVLVSLDPGTGQDDTSVWITSQSPYVQNCTSFTPGGTGFKIDGALHNGGYKSMVANDWTQINSDGVGIHVLNDGRTEIVSCFTYYCDIGYLAESGGKIRGIVGNNSYGEYGAVARGFSQSETPLTGQLQLDDTTLNSVTSLASNVHVFTSYRDSVGNRFFVGHTNPTGTDVTSTFDNTASYPFIAKFNSAGSLDWIYTYENSFGAIHNAVELSDRIYCGGVIYDGSNKGFILSISKAGEIQWQKTIGNTTEITDVTTDDNNLYAVGSHSTAGTTVIKLNPVGIEQWSRTLDYNDSAAAGNLVPTSCTFAGVPTTSVDTYALAGDATAEDNLYIAAYDSGVNQSVITRMTSVGNLVTSYIYGDVRINSLSLDTGNGDGIYLMAAGYYDAGAVNKNPLLFRLSVDGTVQWQYQLSLGAEEGEWSDVLPFGNDVYVSGYINDNSNGNNNGLIARFTSNGTIDWLQTFENDTNNVSLNGVMLDGVNVIAAGIENGNSVILNIQRDLSGGIGTVATGLYGLVNPASTSTTNTVVTKNESAVDSTNVVLGVTDTSLTLNQTPAKTRSVAATRAGFAGIGTGVSFAVDNLSRSPKEGSVLQIAGDQETYFVIGVNNFDDVAGTCNIQIDPAIPSNKTPNDNTTLTFREAYSQVRMSGHDFLDIGTGGFADTNYPVIIDADYTQQPDQGRETLAENGGRVFYVTTDQDGNFRVGDYFKVEQATGRATLSSEEFDLAGLNELQLGSITAGKQGATINEFSTDGTFADNSDSAVPTEKAVKTYVDGKVAASGTIKVGSSPNISKVEVNGTGAATDTIDFDINGSTIAQLGSQYQLVPKGNTASRPSVPVAGYIRYNTDVNALEIYQGSAWVPAGGLSNINLQSADSPYSASAFQSLWLDSNAGSITVTLPASAQQGDEIRFLDVSSTFTTSPLTVARNGHNIQGAANDLTVNTARAGFSLVYYNATQGWLLKEV